MKKKNLKIRSWLRQLGPGLVTGAADDDPSGIATYSQAGAKFGYELGWTVVLTYPLMVAVQMISARLGRVTGRGLADNIRENFPAPVLYALVWRPRNNWTTHFFAFLRRGSVHPG